LSKIFDALKRAQQSRAAPMAPDDAASDAGERRRSPRCNAHVPIFIYSHASNEQPFHEEAYSACVSDLGGLLVMTATVRPGQTLLLTNKVTQRAQECRVVHTSGRDPQTIHVAVEFLEPAAEFWRVTALSRSEERTHASAKRRRRAR
jgi:hypothetical protein